MREASGAVEWVGGVVVVTAPEEIDITNAAGLRAGLLEAAGLEAAGLEAGLTMGGHPAFVVDMTRTRFCDSAGIAGPVRAPTPGPGARGPICLAHRAAAGAPAICV